MEKRGVIEEGRTPPEYVGRPFPTEDTVTHAKTGFVNPALVHTASKTGTPADLEDHVTKRAADVIAKS